MWTLYINDSFAYYVSSFYIATYETQSIDITSSTSGEVCVVCRFSINTIAVGCELQLQNSTVTLSRRFNRDVNIAEGCISNIITGYYDLYVYDVENDNTLSQLPAIIKNQVFVDERTTTTLQSQYQPFSLQQQINKYASIISDIVFFYTSNKLVL